MGHLSKFFRSTVAGPLVAFLVVAAAVSLATPRFLQAQNLANVSLQVATVAVVSIGATLVILTGGIDLSPGSTVALVTCTLAILVKNMGLPLPVGIACGIALLWGLLMSASFTGFAATSLAVLVTLAIAGRRYLGRIVLPAALLVGAFVYSGAPLPAIFEQRVGGALVDRDIQEAGTYNGRVGLIGEAWQMTENTSLIGVGADEFRQYSSDHQPVHNLYLLMWTEGGIIALLGFLAMLAMLVMLALGRISRGPETALALSAVTVFLIYTVASPHMFARLWIMPVVLALGPLYGRDEDNPAGYRSPSFWAVA